MRRENPSTCNPKGILSETSNVKNCRNDKLLSERRCKFVCTVYLIHQQICIDGRLVVEAHSREGWANRKIVTYIHTLGSICFTLTTCLGTDN